MDLPPRARRLPRASEAGRAMIAGTPSSSTLALQRNTTPLLVTALYLLCSTSSISASTTPALTTQLNLLQTELRAAREKEKTKSLTGCFFVGHQAPDVDTVASAMVAAWMYNGLATLPASEKDLGKDVQLVLADANAASKQANATDAVTSASALVPFVNTPSAISDEVAKRTAQGGGKSRNRPCVVLVDHNEEKQRPVAVQQGLADVVAIFDHHKIDSSAAIASDMVEYMQVGSTATLLFQKMNTTYVEAALKKEHEADVAAGAAAKTNPAPGENSNSAAAASSSQVAQQQQKVGEDENIIMQKEHTKALLSLIPKTILRLILYAILSDTVNLTSPTTTGVDRKTVSVINNFLSLSPNNQNKMWLEMATAKDAELAALSFDKLLEKDAKLFTAGSCNVHIGVAEFLDTATLQKMLHDEGTVQLAKSMERAKGNMERVNYELQK